MDSTVMYDLRAVAKLYAVTTPTVVAWIRAGDLRAVNVGRAPGKRKPRYRIPASALAEFEAARSANPSPTTRERRAPRKRTENVVKFY